MNEQGTPRIRRGFRLQFEPVQKAHVLLYPEGMIKLNESAAEVLLLIDGKRDVARIISELSERFADAPGIADDIHGFIEVAHAQHWIEFV